MVIGSGQSTGIRPAGRSTSTAAGPASGRAILLYNDARFVLPQGFSSPDSFFDLLRRGFDYLWEEGRTHPRMMSIGLHPRFVGQAARTSALRDFIDHARNKGDVWFARRIDIANWWNEHHEEFESG